MKPEKGAEMALFGGNIKGEVVDVDPPTSFATTWRAPNWPEGTAHLTRVLAILLNCLHFVYNRSLRAAEVDDPPRDELDQPEVGADWGAGWTSRRDRTQSRHLCVP